jgi:hypothetical protein
VVDDLQEQVRTTRVVLATAHRDHDPTNNRPRNLVALCQRAISSTTARSTAADIVVQVHT